MSSLTPSSLCLSPLRPLRCTSRRMTTVDEASRTGLMISGNRRQSCWKLEVGNARGGSLCSLFSLVASPLPPLPSPHPSIHPSIHPPSFLFPSPRGRRWRRAHLDPTARSPKPGRASERWREGRVAGQPREGEEAAGFRWLPGSFVIPFVAYSSLSERPPSSGPPSSSRSPLSPSPLKPPGARPPATASPLVHRNLHR